MSMPSIADMLTRGEANCGHHAFPQAESGNLNGVLKREGYR